MTGLVLGRLRSEIGGGELKLAEKGSWQVQATGRDSQGPPAAGVRAGDRDTGAADLVTELPNFRDRITGPSPASSVSS